MTYCQINLTVWCKKSDNHRAIEVCNETIGLVAEDEKCNLHQNYKFLNH